MNFKKDDENIKKYRKLKGWTQEKLAEEINYSLSFISGIESNYHQTFSLGAIWRISQALGVEFTKLCEDDNNQINAKFILYKCNKCSHEFKMPIKVIRHLKSVYELENINDIPKFDCPDCDGKITPVNPMDL